MGYFIDLELEHTSFPWVSVKHLETIVIVTETI